MENSICFVVFIFESFPKRTTSGTVPLMGRSAIMGDKKNNNFLDVAFGKGDLVYSLFSTKFFLLLNEGYHNICPDQIRIIVSA